MKLKLCLRFEGYFMKLCHELMFCHFPFPYQRYRVSNLNSSLCLQSVTNPKEPHYQLSQQRSRSSKHTENSSPSGHSTWSLFGELHFYPLQQYHKLAFWSLESARISHPSTLEHYWHATLCGIVIRWEDNVWEQLLGKKRNAIWSPVSGLKLPGHVFSEGEWWMGPWTNLHLRAVP